MAIRNRQQFLNQLRQELKKAVNLNNLSDSTLVNTGNAYVRAIKERISKGISPIGRGGRFPAYKNPKRYPGTKKPARPVNLKLTGAFLNDLIFRIVRGTKPRIVIFFRTNLSNLKESGHREGVNSQPKRPILPQGNEDFTPGIHKDADRELQKGLDRDLA